MDMSLIEITARANFLVFDYIKRTINHNELAEQFRSVIQESSHKDIIIFKGLEDLTLILKKYYGAQASTIGESNNNPANVEESETMAPQEAEAGGLSKQERKRKKKQKELTGTAENCGQQPAPESEEPQQPQAGDDKAERKRKKNKRQLEAEAGEQPEVTANGHETAAEHPVAEEEGQGKAPKKKRKKQKYSLDGSVEANNSQEADALVEQQLVVAASLSAEAAESTAGGGGANSGNKARQQKQHNQPFRRVREEEVVNKHFKDNSFDAKPGSNMGWGYKANEDLRPTQGRSFRHEKTKKKRGSYKGGAIDTGVSSFKFESDSE